MNIRNFSIIAHIDHGKSTLADRMLEVTNTIEKRKMRDQVLDNMELERERGITIKMQPVRMKHSFEGREYVLNLIDTPGHIDFSYEVSRALKAVEGSILLVDATQGVQAQTLTTLAMARESGLVIIPVLSKIDSPLARKDEVKEEIVKLIGCKPEDVLETSGRTGEGVAHLLDEVIRRVPAPTVPVGGKFRSLVFDFKYSNHKGVIVYVRVMEGKVSKGEQLLFKVSNEKFSSLDTGVFMPDETPTPSLEAGEIGYIVTGVKEPGVASVGDTVALWGDTAAPLPGYEKPRPVVWASIYPESQDDFNTLRQALGRLKLSDSSFVFEEESSGALGRGFRCGFLGMLHLEIITERLRREFTLELIVTSPSITYEVELKNGKKEMVYSPSFFPDEGNVAKIYEPWTKVSIITPTEYLGALMQLLYEHEAVVGMTENFGSDRTTVSIDMPLRELMRNFFDKVKSASSGYASISYEMGEMKPADVVRLDILVADEVIPAFSRVVSRRLAEEEAEHAVEKLHGILPKQMFVMKIQGRALGRIISSRTVSAYSKDVTQHMYGGDITRKMKLREKQKKGKKKMKERGKGSVNIPHDVFLKMMRNN
ncbi:MAG TPA: translation elongation factor 4 [Candidatus Paceibacterota bacterium]|jgi:GTP-binding protein LepA|nr:translation elongation factor 4 [Candidatus Paceibacterota bacterium]